jgi:hypothetical protein
VPTTFEDRERAFEAKFAHEQEFRFLVSARRDKLLARWAADRMALSDDEARALAVAVLAIPDRPDHEEAMLRRIQDQLSAQGKPASRAELTGVLRSCMQQALQQLTQKPPEYSGIL